MAMPAKPDAALTKALCSKAVESGLILLSCGVRGNVIRILAPLTIDMEHLEEGLAILAELVRGLRQTRDRLAGRAN